MGSIRWWPQYDVISVEFGACCGEGAISSIRKHTDLCLCTFYPSLCNTMKALCVSIRKLVFSHWFYSQLFRNVDSWHRFHSNLFIILLFLYEFEHMWLWCTKKKMQIERRIAVKTRQNCIYNISIPFILHSIGIFMCQSLDLCDFTLNHRALHSPRSTNKILCWQTTDGKWCSPHKCIAMKTIEYFVMYELNWLVGKGDMFNSLSYWHGVYRICVPQPTGLCIRLQVRDLMKYSLDRVGRMIWNLVCHRRHTMRVHVHR